MSALSARLERSGSVGSVGSAGSRSSTRRSRIAPARHRHRRRRRKRDDEDDDEDLDDDGLPDSPDEDVVVRTQETADELYHRKPVLKSHEARGFFADQFENRANYTAHYESVEPSSISARPQLILPVNAQRYRSGNMAPNGRLGRRLRLRRGYRWYHRRGRLEPQGAQPEVQDRLGGPARVGVVP